MAGNNIKVNGQLDLTLNLKAEAAKQELANLQKQLQTVSNIELKSGRQNQLGEVGRQIKEASSAAMQLQSHLAAATNVNTGNLDFSKFSQSLGRDGKKLAEFQNALIALGPQGKNAFLGLANSIAKSEIPLKRTNKLLDTAWSNLKKTAGWQLSSSVIHGIIGGMQQAIGYAKDLDRSLNDIRIVTGASSDQMARFAQQANKAAKSLSTTTTDYTKASLIYYQQGLSDAEVKARTETTIKMANVTGTTAQKVSDQMTAIWNNYDNGTKSLEYYADAMAALGAKTASSTDEIAQGLQKFASISQTVGLSYEYAASALATVTSTSRESADVVGNAFKTLFARIQGLQLGETLEDGTTLNKYSQALNKVGISIKDSSGEMKSMDSILDEMGAKWTTLGKDQQMALAQTVAGVRQYTQLMTLMNNWDFFKQNVNVASTSSGTLDSQMAIYEESWQAASNRLRSAWEGLWDSLINSDSFTTILDGMASFVSMLEGIVDGIGGAGGVLTTFGGILTRVFSTQITNNVASLASGIRQLSPGARQKDYETRKEWIASSKGWKLTESGFAGTKEAAIIRSNLDKYADESFNREKARQFMSQQQLGYDDRIQASIDEAREMQRQGAAEVDAANKTLIDVFSQHQIGGKETVGNLLKGSYATQAQGEAQQKYDDWIGKFKLPKDVSPESIKTESEFQKYLQAGGHAKGVSIPAAWADFQQARAGAMSIPGTSVEAVLGKAIHKGLSFKEGFTKDFWDNTTKNENGTISPNYEAIRKAIKQRNADTGLGASEADIDAKIDAIRDGKGTASEKAAALRGYVNDELSRTAYNQAVDDSSMTQEQKDFFKSDDYRQEQFKKAAGYRKTLAGKKLEQDKLGERDENDKQISSQKKIQGAVSVAQGLMSTTAMISSLEGLGSALQAVSSGAGDATAILSSLTSAGLNGAMAFSSLSSVMGGPWAAGIMAAITLVTLAAKAIDKNNVSEKERIKTLKQSDAEIQNATENTTRLSESYKEQNKSYQQSVEAAKTNSTASAEMIDDIFQANKQAMDLIQQYELTSDQYTKNTAGLIEINEQVLKDKEQAMEDASADFQRTQALSNLTTKRELAEKELADFLSNDQISGYTESTKGSGDTAQSYTRYYFGDDEGNKWTFEDALKAYGTAEWDTAKQYAIDHGYNYEDKFNKLEEQILAYQEANNLMNLAAKNNVDSLLRAQEYTLDGYETFAKLGYDDYIKAYNQQYDSGSFSGTNSNSLLTDANKKKIEEYLKAQGYTGIENIKFDGSDIAKFTFDHDDGSGDVNVEAIRKWDAEQAGSSAAETTFGKSMDLLQALYQTQGADAASGLMSLLTGDNFENATINEMNKAKEAAAAIADDMYAEWDSKGDARKGTDEDIAASISKHFGKDMTAAELKDLLNLDPTTNLIDWFNNFKHVQSSAQRLIEGEPLLKQWVGDNEEIANNINQNTLTSLYSNFKQASLLGGEQAGKDMLTGITEVLSNSGLSEDEYDQALQGLLSIDWSNTLSSGGAAAAVIENLGGTLDTTTAAWQAFASAMEVVSGAMPDFSEVIAQLTDLAAAVQGLSGGDLIDPEIVEQLINLNPEFADMFSKHHSGKYTFIGDDNSELKNAIWDEMNNKKSEASDIEGKYDEYVEGKGKGLESNNAIDANDFGYRDVGGTRVYDQTHAMNLANIAGYSNAQVRDILTGYETSNINLSAWGKDWGRNVNGTQVRLDGEGNYLTQDAEGNWTKVTDQAKIAEYTAAHSQDQTVFNTTKAAHDTLMNSIHGLDEVSGEWTQEEVEAAVSTADSAADVFDRIQKGQEGFKDEDGTLSEGVLKGLQALPETSERATTAIDNLVEAEANYAENKTEANRLIYEEALRNAELQTSIDAVAKARGVDADLLAQQVAALEASGQAANYSATDTAKLAAEIVEQNQAIDDLEDNYSTLSKSLRSATKGSNEWMSAMSKLKKTLGGILSINDWNNIPDAFVEAADAAGILQKAANGDADAIEQLRTEQIKLDKAMESGLITAEDIAGLNWNQIGEKVNSAFEGSNLQQWAADFNSVMDTVNAFDVGELITGDANFNGKLSGILSEMGAFSGSMSDLFDACSQLGITPEIVGPFSSMSEATAAGFEGSQFLIGDPAGTHEFTNNVEAVENHAAGGGSFYGVRFRKGGGGGSGTGGGGGGGGGEPKKVANKRKSQTVKRYKKNDARRSSAQAAKKSASTQKDYLYGESKIAQMEKINKLAAKEAAITSDRIKESRKYMVEDRENLIKYMQKYGYEAEFDADGFLNNYEDAWGKIHDKIAKLYEDNELTKDEQKLEEDYKVELEELEGALEDYENSLKELQSDIEAYEESLYEMYDNKVEQMQHKVEFKIELNEDDLSYLDFWIEALGDSLYNALESLQTMGAKTNVLFDGISTYKQGIEDIYALSDDPFQAWATGGLDDVLTQDQVDALRENRDGLMDYMQQLLDLRQTMQDKVLDVFDKWQEKLSNTMSTIEHYGSVIEHFRNIMDVVGKDALGLDDQFMARFEQSAIDQSMDNIDATKAHYESLVSQNEEAQRRLAEARARGDKASEEHWQGVVDSTTEAMQSAQDSLLSSLESTLDMIASQFESAMTRAVEAFNDVIYEHGGLSGLSEDYSFMREQSELMAEDYDKIYQLSKLNRNINKTLSDTNIIAGKQKMKSLQQEINELQASGVELSKYDLDYLQAKYELRLAEIELENAKNAKDTVRLSKDSEGNWSYIYTSSTDKVDEAQQKYEDALYAMQNLSYEYMEEMSNGMMQTSLAMMEKIQSLRIQDFDSYEAYAAEVKRIQDQYAGSLQNQQNELDKSMMNNQDLYNQDWQAYSEMTGYKISAAQDWADNFSETTLGALMGSESSTSDFADTVFGLSNTLSNDLGTAAMSYFTNVETAMNKYGTSINGFGSTVTTTVGNISTKSKAAANDMKTMAEEMNDAFTDITESVANWQKEFSGQIDSMLKEIGALVQSINEAIQKSAEMTGTKQVGDLIGSAEAAELLSGHEEYDFGDWKMDGSQLKVKGVGEDEYSATTFVEENAKLINEINDKLLEYTEAKTGSEDRARLGEELEALFKKYHAFKDIVSRVYDPTTLAALKLDNPNYASMDTGGYTGEWGDSGKFAMLHEKELVLNQDDTKNFLDALSISRDVLHSMIEMNAKQSSLALGDLYPSSIQDMSQMLEQQVSISAEFPNATERSEIEDAFNSLINTASQYANRYR